MNRTKNYALTRFWVLLFLGINIFSAFSQDAVPLDGRTNAKVNYNDAHTQKITPPNVAAFYETKLMNVTNYSGSANISVPIYTINDGDISIPIRLNYNSTGVKANETASNVGLNWSLEAGGSITKVIKGFEDFSLNFRNPQRELFPNEGGINTECGGSDLICQTERKVKYDDFANPIPTLKDCTIESLGWFLNDENISVKNFFDYPSNNPDKIYLSEQLISQNVKKDTYPDFYYASAPGLSTEFTHRKDKTPFEIKYQGNIIETTVGKSDTIKFLPSFTNNLLHNMQKTYYGSKHRRITCVNNIDITNINGVQYKFNDLDVNQYVTRSSLDGVKTYSPLHVSSQEVTSYHLSSLKDIKGNEVNFKYHKYSVKQVVASKSQDFNINKDESTYSLSLPNITEVYYPQLNRIKEIKHSKGSVFFSYGKNRRDLPGDQALTQIVIKDIHDKIIKKINFEYDYFVANTNCNEAHCLRLKLKTVTEYNSKDEKLPSHEFFYDETQLPEIGSDNVDYLGYANGIKSNYDNDRSPLHFKKAPAIYYKRNKKELSFSPIKIFKGSYLTTGTPIIPSLVYTKAASLLRIKKPTGANQYFTYELNTFSTQDIKNITAAGLRLKKQIIKDEKEHVKLLEEYFYTDEKGYSSGVLNSMPSFGNVREHGFNHITTPVKYGINQGTLSFRIYSAFKNNLRLILGNNIGYARVIVKNGINNGTIERQYYTIKDEPIDPPYSISINDSQIDFALNNGSHFSFFNNKALSVGNLRLERLRDYKNKIIEEKEYNYTYELFEEMVQKVTMYKSQLIPVVIADGEPQFFFYPKIFSHRNLQTQISNKSFFSNHHIENNTTIIYDPKYSIVKESTTTTDKNDVITSKNYFVTDVENSSSLGNNVLTTEELIAIDALKEENRIAQPIQTETYKNEVLLGRQRTNFKKWDNNIVLPKNMEAAKGEALLEERVVFEEYDNNGNVIEAAKKNGSKVYYLWGYHKNQPIAKIEGYTLITAAQKNLMEEVVLASNSDNDRTVGYVGAEGNLRSKLTELRNSFISSTAQVTTYTYDALIGITSITDTRGRTMYYNYDDYNRLEFIKDSENNVVTQYCYNYKGERKKCNVITDNVIIGNVSSTTNKAFIRLEKKGIMIPIPATSLAPTYTWSAIENLPSSFDRLSLNSFFHFPRISSLHGDDIIPFPIEELRRDAYNLNDEYFKNGYFKVFRDGYTYSIEGLEDINLHSDGQSQPSKEDFVLQWSMLIDGKKYPLIKPTELRENVFFVPYCFGNKLGKIICEVYLKGRSGTKNLLHVITTFDITFKGGFQILDNHDSDGYPELNQTPGFSNFNFDCIQK